MMAKKSNLDVEKMRIPTTLKHKPVIVCENYEEIDGKSANNSEAKGLSLGLAQWNDRGKVDISGKVWRHTGGKWSRQSEELPLHRIIDMAILICKSKDYVKNSDILEYDKENPMLEKVALQGKSMDIEVCTDNEFIDEDIELFVEALSKDDELLDERLSALSKALKDMGY